MAAQPRRPTQFQPSANLLCVRCHATRQDHKEGAPGSCSQFCNVLPKRHRKGKVRHVPGALERALIDGDK